MGSAFEQIVADELQKAKHQNGVVQEPEAQDGLDTEEKDVQDMLWEHETPDAPTELGDEEYEALMLAMEDALYEDMHAELEGRGESFSRVYFSEHRENKIDCPVI